MGAVSGAISNKSCTWDFNVEGNPQNTGAFLGISFTPGEMILDVKVRVLTALVGAAATVFAFQFGNPNYGSGIGIAQNTVDVYNGLIGYSVSNTTPPYFFTAPNNLPFPIGYLGDTNVYASSDGAITGGSILLSVTYTKHTV